MKSVVNIIQTMKNILVTSALAIITFVACSDDVQEYDPYFDWQVRNEAWYRSVADSARMAIAKAKQMYGEDWDKAENCQWRMFKTLYQAQDYDTGRLTDSICVRIASRGTGDYSPTWSDSVRISYRGWMMPTTYKLYNADNVLVDSTMQEVFSQSYYGEFTPKTAAPVLSAITPFVEGFNTALQYMVEGDDWFVYIPCQLAYGETAKNAIPAYSTLLFRIHLAAIYPAGSGVPTWKTPMLKNE